MRIGLVFAGGGGKGSYEIGVWKALDEFNLSKNIISVAGSSVGALNSALFMQGDFNLAESLWYQIKQDSILSLDHNLDIKKTLTQKISNSLLNKYLLSLKSYGFFSRKGLLEIIDKNLDLHKISCSEITGFCTCFRSTIPFKTEYFKINGLEIEEIRNILLASSALPIIFDSIEVNNESYIDGGIGDNIPIKPIYDNGCDIIIVVHLSRETIIDKSRYPEAQILEIIPMKDLGSFVNGTLDFNPKNVTNRIEAGYKDTKKILIPIFSYLQTQQSTIEKTEMMYKKELQYKESYQQLKNKADNIKKTYKDKKEWLMK